MDKWLILPINLSVGRGRLDREGILCHFRGPFCTAKAKSPSNLVCVSLAAALAVEEMSDGRKDS
jgi:hypothetical protein